MENLFPHTVVEIYTNLDSIVYVELITNKPVNHVVYKHGKLELRDYIHILFQCQNLHYIYILFQYQKTLNFRLWKHLLLKLATEDQLMSYFLYMIDLIVFTFLVPGDLSIRTIS